MSETACPKLYEIFGHACYIIIIIIIIRVIIMLQRFNSVLLHDTLPVDLPDI